MPPKTKFADRLLSPFKARSKRDTSESGPPTIPLNLSLPPSPMSEESGGSDISPSSYQSVDAVDKFGPPAGAKALHDNGRHADSSLRQMFAHDFRGGHVTFAPTPKAERSSDRDPSYTVTVVHNIGDYSGTPIQNKSHAATRASLPLQPTPFIPRWQDPRWKRRL